MQHDGVHAGWNVYAGRGIYTHTHTHPPHQVPFSSSFLPLRRDAFTAEVGAHFLPNMSVDLCESDHCCFTHLAVLIVQQLADGWHCLGKLKTSGPIPVASNMQQVLK